MRNLILAVLFACGLSAQTTNYPGSLDTDSTLFITADNVQTTISLAMAPTDNVAIVASGTGFAVNMIVTICDSTTQVATGVTKCTAWEHMLVTAVNGQALTVTRGVAGTSARSHAVGAVMSVLIDAAHQQSLKAATLALETALGTHLSNIALNVKTFGAVGNGTADDTTAIQSTINALPTSGGTVYFPPGTYKITSTLTMGNGSSSANSTTNNIRLQGAGGSGDLISVSGASHILWAGSTNGTMLTLNGPMTGPSITDLVFDGAGTAGTCLDLEHPQDYYFARLLIDSCTSKGILIQAYDMAGINQAGAGPGTFEHILITPAGTNSQAWVIGAAAWNADSFDVARLYARDIEIRGSGSNTNAAMELRFVDSSVFDNVSIEGWSSGTQVKFTPTTGNVNFPGGIIFNQPWIASNLIGTSTFTISNAVASGNQCQLTITGHKFSQANEYMWLSGGTGAWSQLSGRFQIFSILDSNNVLVAAQNPSGSACTGFGSFSGQTITGVYGADFIKFNGLVRDDGVDSNLVWPSGMFFGSDSYGNQQWAYRVGVADNASTSYGVHVLETGKNTVGGIDVEGRQFQACKTLRVDNISGFRECADFATPNLIYSVNGGDKWLTVPNATNNTLTFGRPLNYIATESGSANAIAGSLTNANLYPGVCVQVQLAHTLQAGSNTFALNGGTALAIKSHLNPANNIANAYAATGVVSLCYNGSVWLDMGQ
jgi:hypothetical protein